MDDEDPRIDELDAEIARLRARVAELEAMEARAREVQHWTIPHSAGAAAYILGEK